MGWVINATPRPLYPGKDPVPIVQDAVWTVAENLTPTGIGSPDRPARGESLYQLHYPGPQTGIVDTTNSNSDITRPSVL